MKPPRDNFQLELEPTKDALPPKPKGWGTRHTLAFLGFWGFAISYAMRFNLSLAIVSMAGSRQTNGVKPKAECGPDNLNSSLSGGGMEQGEFDWTEKEQGLILGSFFWGYVLTQLPGGILSDKYGGKWPLGLGLLVTAVFAILTPWAARTHWYLLMLCRVIQGLGEGLTTPAMHEILSNWAPPQERSQLAGIVYAGSQFGTAAVMIVSGYLIDLGVMGGWPSVFYTIGIFSIGWFILWAMLMYDEPAQHPRITKEELHYIEKSIGNKASDAKVPTPWKEIFTSMPVWAIIVGHVGHAWGLYTLLTMLPKYLNSVFAFDIKSNSWLSAIPYILMWITSIIIPMITDYLLSKNIVRTVVIRKSCQSIAHLGSALLLIAASYSGCDQNVTIVLICAAVAINGAIYSGYVMNHVDIASRHSGVLMGITNTFANLTGFLSPAVSGILINEEPSLRNWQLVFFISGAIYVFDVVFYAMFATSTEQKWNRAKQ